MKKLYILMILSIFLLVAQPLWAIERIIVKTNGSILYRCELAGSAFKVEIKEKGNGRYYARRRGKGSTGYTGYLYAASADDAARKACKE